MTFSMRNILSVIILSIYYSSIKALFHEPLFNPKKSYSDQLSLELREFSNTCNIIRNLEAQSGR